MPDALRVTETDQGYMLLRGAILDGRFHPNERLIETDLARTFAIGRAAVRTALAQLDQDGLVVREPFRGARVRAISAAEGVEILEARAALESLAVRYAAQRATAETDAVLQGVLAAMQERFDAGDLLGMSELNEHLHGALLRVANHATAARLIAGLRAQNVRHQFRTILVPGRAHRSLREHRAIVAAVAARDAEAAEAAMRAHLSEVVAALRAADRGGTGRAGGI